MKNLLLFFLLISCVLFSCEQPKQEDAPSLADKLQGVWKNVGVKIDSADQTESLEAEELKIIQANYFAYNQYNKNQPNDRHAGTGTFEAKGDSIFETIVVSQFEGNPEAGTRYAIGVMMAEDGNSFTQSFMGANGYRWTTQYERVELTEQTGLAAELEGVWTNSGKQVATKGDSSETINVTEFKIYKGGYVSFNFHSNYDGTSSMAAGLGTYELIGDSVKETIMFVTDTTASYGEDLPMDAFIKVDMMEDKNTFTQEFNVGGGWKLEQTYQRVEGSK